jgi:TrmH family RNA methyltransferase
VTIDSPANPRVRAAAALRERRERERTGLTLVDGLREARRAIDAGVEVETAFIQRAAVDGSPEPGLASLREALERRGVRPVEVSGRVMTRLAFGHRAEGAVLVVRPRLADLATLLVGRSAAITTETAPVAPSPAAVPLVVITEDVEKPGNLGAILRTADAVAADAVIAIGGTDLHNPNVIRASLGTVFGLPLASASADEAHAWASGRGLAIVAAQVDAPRLHVEADLRGPLAIVLGNEAEGLSSTWRGKEVTAVRLPMLGVADSLNVAAAAAVLLYEAWRQRHVRG